MQINKTRAVKLLEEVVQREGADKVYVNGQGQEAAMTVDPVSKLPSGLTACDYVHYDHEGENPIPGCIVGHALIDNGMAMEDAENLGGPIAFEVKASRHVNATPGATAVFAAAQAVQDAGGTWGLAYLAARAVASALPDDFE